MTTETWSGALCGSTLQSSRRSGEAANADRALEEVRLRVAAPRMPDDEPGRAEGEEQAKRPLHPWLGPEGEGLLRGGDGNDRAQPAAEGAGEDVERPVHADNGARDGHDERSCHENYVPGTESDRHQAGDGEGGGGMAGREAAGLVAGADDMHVRDDGRGARDVEEVLEAVDPQRAQEREEEEGPQQVGAPAPQRKAK